MPMWPHPLQITSSVNGRAATPLPAEKVGIDDRAAPLQTEQRADAGGFLARCRGNARPEPREIWGTSPPSGGETFVSSVMFGSPEFRGCAGAAQG